MIPKTRARRASPGDTAVVLLQPARDTSGREWPRGTIMQPLCGGMSPEGRYCDLSAGMDKVRFID